MSQVISNYIKSCKICQLNKLNKEQKYGSLSQIGPAIKPFDIISIDTVGGLGGYNSMKQYIHIAIDHFTRFTWTFASRTQCAKDFINLINNVKQSQKPKQILADRYTGINSSVFKRFCCNNEIKLTFIL